MPLCRSPAVPVGGLEGVDTGCTLSASRFLGCREARNHEDENRVYDSRVLERGCGLKRTVVEGVHVEDKAGDKPPTSTSNIACFKYGLG